MPRFIFNMFEKLVFIVLVKSNNNKRIKAWPVFKWSMADSGQVDVHKIYTHFIRLCFKVLNFSFPTD